MRESRLTLGASSSSMDNFLNNNCRNLMIQCHEMLTFVIFLMRRGAFLIRSWTRLKNSSFKLSGMLISAEGIEEGRAASKSPH